MKYPKEMYIDNQIFAGDTDGGLSVGNKTISDQCCGSRMFWFDRNSPELLKGVG